MSTLWTILFIIAPLPVLILVGRIRILRQRRNAATETVPAKPFDPSTDPVSSVVLSRHFSVIESVYLRQQMPGASSGFYMVFWLVFAVMTASLLPESVNSYPIEQSHAMRVWYSFLHASLMLSVFGTAIAVITALVVSVGLAGKGAQTTFYRTRPLTYRLLFWGRVIPALCAMILGYLAGLAGAFAILLACYGSVWNHLDVSGLPMLLKLSQVYELVWLLRSPLPMFLSIATSMVLIFSISLALLLQPFQIRALPKPLSFVAAFFVFEAFSFLGSYRTFPSLSHLGLTPSGMNAPPPLPMYLLPLTLAVFLLWIAQRSTSRKES